MIFQFVISAAILRKLASEANFKKALSKLLLISCAWKGACDRKRLPQRTSRALFFLALTSAAPATLGLGDGPAVLPIHE